MQRRPFGSTGLEISALCLGTMNFGGATTPDESRRILERALEAGIDAIDTAPAYGGGASESRIGAVLAESGRRDDVFLATKVFVPDGQLTGEELRRYVVGTCEASLERLRTDRVELFLLHRPLFAVPLDEVLRALDDLVQEGKVRFVGCSTHPPGLIREALALAARLDLSAFVAEQPPYNLLDRRFENELMPLCREHGLAVLPWAPLAGGILAGRYPPDGGIPEDTRAARIPPYRGRVTAAAVEVAERVGELAARRGLTAAQLALLWIRDRPGVTAPVIGPRTLEHLEAALAVAHQKLDDEARAELETLVPSGRAVSDFWFNAGWSPSEAESR